MIRLSGMPIWLGGLPMSEGESKQNLEAVLTKGLDRLGESLGPALGMPRLLGVEHLMNSLTDARQRVRDSHTMQQAKLRETLGIEATENVASDDEEEDVERGISVQGDTHITVQSEPKQAAASAASGVGKILLAAALGAVGAGLLPSLWSYFNQTESTTIVQPGDEWGLDLEVKDHP